MQVIEVVPWWFSTEVPSSIKGITLDEEGESSNKEQHSLTEPTTYPRPKGTVSFFLGGSWVEVRAMLDSRSNIFLLSPKFCNQWNVPKVQRDDTIMIRSFDGKAVSNVGHAFTKKLRMLIGTDHTSNVSCEIGPVEPGLDLIIPGHWWISEHPVTNPYENPWITGCQCQDQSLNMNQISEEHKLEASKENLEIEWDESILEMPEARVVETLHAIDDEIFDVLQLLHERYHAFSELFTLNKVQPLPRRRFYDHAIDLQTGETAPWGAIYSLSAHKLEVLRKYLDEMIRTGKIQPSKS